MDDVSANGWVLGVESPFPGEWLARDTDLRTDLPCYRVFREGVLVEEVGSRTRKRGRQASQC